jgi:hypothetical protein
MAIAFNVIVGFTIVLILIQIKTADILDMLRFHNKDFWYHLRRGTMFLKAGTLCWTVVYSHNLGWAPWTPIVWFLIAFDIHIVGQIVVMNGDIKKLSQTSRNHVF